MRKVLSLFTIILFISSIYTVQFINQNENNSNLVSAMNNKNKAIQEKKESFVNASPLTINVKLQRLYIDGEISEEMIEQTIWSMADFWAQYEDWQLVDQEEGLVIFRKNIDDISPLLKANGYFGVDNNGHLTIYNGTPEMEEVIQSFFQIDLDKLESNLKEELKKGIVIYTKDDYHKLIETMKEYEIK